MKKLIMSLAAFFLFVSNTTFAMEIPSVIRTLVFNDENYLAPVEYQFEEDKIEHFNSIEKHVRNPLDMDTNFAFRKYTNNTNQLFNFDMNDYNGELCYLLSNKLAYVKIANSRVSEGFWRDAKNASIKKVPYLFFSNKFLNIQNLNKCDLQKVTNGYCLKFANRKLLSIDYTNKYKGSPQGVELTFYSITFTYNLSGHLPYMPELSKTFKGKAKAYHDPDDGEWKLLKLELTDTGVSEFRKQLDNKFKDIKASDLIQEIVSVQPQGEKTYSHKNNVKKSGDVSGNKRNVFSKNSRTAIDPENNVELKTNPTTLKLKKEMAIKLVAYTLQNGKMGIEKTLSYDGKLLFGVTLTKSFTHLKKFQCKEYRVISYESGKAITKLDPGKVCKVKGKWYPYILLTNSSRKSVPGDEFIKAMIGRWQ